MTSPQLLSQIPGQSVRAVRRIFYEREGALNTSRGPIEITSASGSVFLFDAGPDGESLSIKSRPWVDAFAGKMSEENQTFVASSGKWVAVDVSNEPDYSGVIGSVVISVIPMKSDGVKVVGVEMIFDILTLRIEAAFDELKVELLPANESDLPPRTM